LLNIKYINKCTLLLRMNVGVRVELRMPKTMIKKIDRIAKLTDTTRSEVIRNSLRDYLDKKLLMIGATDE